MRWFERFSTTSANLAGQPPMLGVAILLSAIGAISYVVGNEHIVVGVALAISAVTLILLPILQATQNRDGAALHAKLDELLKIHHAARDNLIGVEKRSSDEIEQVRRDEERGE